MSEISIDQQFIEYVVRSLVGNPDAVSVERIIDEKGVLLTLTVDPDDLGRVIGKRGATAQSLRTLLRALGTKQESRFNLKIVDNGIPREEREAQKESQDQANGNYHSPQRDETKQERQEEDTPKNDGGGWNSGSSDVSSAAQDAANDSGEEESAIERTRRELMDLDDLDV